MSGAARAKLVHHDAVLAWQSRSSSEIVVGARAGRDQNKIGSDALARREQDAAGTAFAFDRGKARVQPDVDAARAVQRVEEGGYVLAGDALHHAAFGFDHDRVAALLPHDGRDLEADVAAADDGDAASRRRAPDGAA